MDFTRARIEIRKLERKEAHAWPQLTAAVKSLVQSLPGIQRSPRALQPEAFDEIVHSFLDSTAGNPLLLGVDTRSLARKTNGYLRMRRLARVRMLVEGRAAESGYVVLELTMTASRRRWRLDQVILPIVLSRHAMLRYLMRYGQGLGQFQTSLNVALLSIQAWLRVAADHPDVLPVSLAIPVDSGAVLGLPLTLRICEPWCYRLECSHGEVRRLETGQTAVLGASLRTFIHEDMYSSLQEEKLIMVGDLRRRLLCVLRQDGASKDEPLAELTPEVAKLIKVLFATTTDQAWRSAFSCPARQTAHALLTYDQ